MKMNSMQRPNEMFKSFHEIGKDRSAHDDSGTFTTGSTCSSHTIKRIRFDTDEPHIIEVLPSHSDMEPSQKKALWWGTEDYDVFAETAKNISKEVRNHENLTSGIDCAYRRAEEVSKAIEEERIEEAVQELANNSDLAPWCTHGHSRRGLERWGSRLHSTVRLAEAKQHKSKIVELQHSSLNQEELRHAAESQTRAARMFARLMGEADAMAVTRQDRLTTYMRRWSDLGSGTAELDRRARFPRHRTASLPQASWTTMETKEWPNVY